MRQALKRLGPLPLPAQTEMSKLQSNHDELTLRLSSLGQKLSEMASLMEVFWEKQRGLSEWLDSVDEDLAKKEPKKAITSLKELQDCLKDHQVIRNS